MVKLGVDTLSTVPDAPPWEGGAWAPPSPGPWGPDPPAPVAEAPDPPPDPPAPVAGDPDVVEEDASVADASVSDASVADGGVEQPAESPLQPATMPNDTISAISAFFISSTSEMEMPFAG